MCASHVNAERSAEMERSGHRNERERERSGERTYQKTLGRERGVEREVAERRARDTGLNSWARQMAAQQSAHMLIWVWRCCVADMANWLLPTLACGPDMDVNLLTYAHYHNVVVITLSKEELNCWRKLLK